MNTKTQKKITGILLSLDNIPYLNYFTIIALFFMTFKVNEKLFKFYKTYWIAVFVASFFTVIAILRVCYLENYFITTMSGAINESYWQFTNESWHVLIMNGKGLWNDSFSQSLFIINTAIMVICRLYLLFNLFMYNRE